MPENLDKMTDIALDLFIKVNALFYHNYVIVKKSYQFRSRLTKNMYLFQNAGSKSYLGEKEEKFTFN